MRLAEHSPHFETVQRMRIVVDPTRPDIHRLLDMPVPMRDGVALSANIYLPPQAGRYPLLAAMTIYRKETHRQHYEIFSPIPNTHLGIMRFSDDATFEGPDPAFWTAHGYGVLHVDARGFGKSPGAPQPLSLTAYQDFYDTIEWAAHQPWCDGNVGLSGVSYLGTCQYFTAALKPPSLKAINPWDARTDRFRSDYLGGIPNTVMSRWIYENFTIPSLHDLGFAEAMRKLTDVATMPRLITDPIYAERLRLLESVREIEVPTLIGGSISDQGKHSRDAFENFMAIRSSRKWLYIHREPEWAAYYDEAGLALQRRFFDHVLKGIDNGWDQTPPVIARVHRSRDNWQPLTASAWPLPDTCYKRVFLTADAGLAETDDAVGTTTYLSTADGGAQFAICFEEDCEIIGHTRLHLRFSIEEGDDADLFVGLKKLDAAGNEAFFLGESGNNPNDIVSRGWLRASQRSLAPESTDWRPVLSHDRVLPLTPGEIVEVDIEIHPTCTFFARGETLLLRVQGVSIAPSEVAMGFEDKVNRGHHTIHHGQGSSWLQLPVRSPAGSSKEPR